MAAPAYVARRGNGVITATSGNIPFISANTGAFCLVVVLQDGTGAALSGISTSGIADLAGTASSLTAIRAGATPVTVGSPAAGKGYVWVGRFTAASGQVNLTSPGDDMYGAIYEFSGVNAGTALSDVIENGSAGVDAVAALTGTTISDVAVQTLGAERLALNCCFITDDGSGLAAFAGSSGGTWTLSADATFASATGTDGTVAMQWATIASAGTIDGGTDTIVSLPWGVSGFALKPAASGTPHSRSLSDTITLSDEAGKRAGLGKADTITLSDAISRAWVASKSFGDTVTLSDAIGKTAAKSFSDTITLSDAVNVIKILVLQLADTITLSDAASKSSSLGKADTITLSDAITRVWAISRSFGDTLTLTDAQVKTLALAKADTLTLSDAVSKRAGLGKSDTTTLSDAVSKASGLGKSDTVTLSDAIAKSVLKVVTDQIALTDVLTKFLGLSKADTLAVSDAVAKAVGKTTTDTLTLSDAFDAQLGTGGPTNHTLSLSDAIQITDDIARALNGEFLGQGGGATSRSILLTRFGLTAPIQISRR